jgi:SH3-like domain-containing protein
MPVQVFNAALPVELQLTDFSCAVGATFWFLRSIEVDLTQQALQDLMVPTLVSPDLGLLDGTGAGIARFLRDHFGLATTNAPKVSFDDVAARAGQQPIVMGGHAWYISAEGRATGHWVGVRGFDGTQLLLANPGGTGPNFGQQTLDRAGFRQRGGFSAVWMDVSGGAGPSFRVADTQGEGAHLRSDPNTTADVIQTLPEGTLVNGAEHAWRQLTNVDGDDGWLADAFMVSASGQFQVANTNGQGANLRRQPDTNGAFIKLVPEATIVNGAEHAWRHVTTADGTAGWIANDFLIAET